MGFRVKIEGAETIDLSIESVETVKYATDTPQDTNARSKDVGSTMVIRGKILTAVDGDPFDSTRKMGTWSLVPAEKADCYRKVTVEVISADQVIRKITYPNGFVVDYKETFGDTEGVGTFELVVRQKSFTSFAESTEPEEVMSVLNEYHTCLGTLIHKHEGTLDKYAGDGLMVLFNDPLPCPEPAVRAVRMAVEMRDEVGKLAIRWRKYGHELGFGLGISHGFATMGRIGFEGRLHHSAIGSVVNLAARLCGEWCGRFWSIARSTWRLKRLPMSNRSENSH